MGILILALRSLGMPQARIGEDGDDVRVQQQLVPLSYGMNMQPPEAAEEEPPPEEEEEDEPEEEPDEDEERAMHIKYLEQAMAA